MILSKKTCAGLGACGLLLAGLPGLTLAAGHNGKTNQQKPTVQRNLVLGSLTALSASSATVTPPGGTATSVPLTAQTRYVALSQGAAIGGLKTGDQAAIFTRTTTSGTQASILEYDTAPFGVPVRVVGTYGGSTATSLTVKTAGGQSITVQITSSTRYRVNGAATAAPTYTANEAVAVQAEEMTSGGIVAQVITVGQSTRTAGRVVVRGTVASATPTSVTVTLANGTSTTVQLATTTRYIVNGAVAAAAPTFAKGQVVVIVASRQADGSLVAISIQTRTA